MKGWFIGAIIGFCFFILLFGLALTVGRGGHPPGAVYIFGFIYYILTFMGLDLIMALLTPTVPMIFYIIALLLFIGIGSLIGFLFSRNFSYKTKLLVVLIIVIIIAPLSLYSRSLKINDQEIIDSYALAPINLENKWITPNYEICKELSAFRRQLKNKCLDAPLTDLEKFNKFRKIIQKSKDGCVSENKDGINPFCLRNLAVEKNDLEVCYALKDLEIIATIDSCIAEVIYKNNRDVNECPTTKCKSLVGGYFGNNIEICRSIDRTQSVETSLDKDSCIENIAQKTGNKELCNEIENIVSKKSCLGTLE